VSSNTLSRRAAGTLFAGAARTLSIQGGGATARRARPPSQQDGSTMRRTYLAAALAAVTLATAGCKDSTGSKPVPSGSMAFSYTGARSGSYSVSGALTRQGANSFAKIPFAAGVKLSDGAQSYIGIVAYLPVTATTGHEVLFLFPRPAAGANLALVDECADTSCPLGIVAFDTNPDVDVDNSEAFAFNTGTVHVTAINSDRISGTFSGTAADIDGTHTITVTNGTFDVPLVNETQFPTASRSAPTTAFSRLHAPR
jgi:hypothetical protein